MLEALFEIFGEVLLELFFHFIAWLLSAVFADLDSNPNKRKVIKIIVYCMAFIACIVLFILELIYDKTAYALMTTIFLSINIFILGLKLINNT